MAAVVIAVIVLGLIGYWIFKPATPVREDSAHSVASPSEAAPAIFASQPAVTEIPPTSASEKPASVELPVGRFAEMPDSPWPSKLKLETGKLPWETQLDEILAKDLAESAKVRELFVLLAKSPPDAADRIIDELLRLVPDRDYQAEIVPRLINPQTNGRVLSLLFADLMDRPESVHLPVLLAIARLSDHPFSDPARENLQHAVGHDYEGDWVSWDAAVRRRLASGS